MNTSFFPAKRITATDIYLGRKLHEGRIFRHLSQKELGEQLGISYQQIQKYEIGKNRLTAATLYRASCALRLPVHGFYEGLEQLALGELLPALDKDQLALVAALDRIGEANIRKGLIAFIHTLADGLSIGASHA